TILLLADDRGLERGVEVRVEQRRRRDTVAGSGRASRRNDFFEGPLVDFSGAEHIDPCREKVAEAGAFWVFRLRGFHRRYWIVLAKPDQRRPDGVGPALERCHSLRQIWPSGRSVGAADGEGRPDVFAAIGRDHRYWVLLEDAKLGVFHLRVEA